MQQSSARSEGHTSPSCEPLRVTQEAVEAYERRTGIYGIGKVMVEDGHWVIVPKKDVVGARWNNGGNTGANPLGPAALDRDRDRDRTNSATTGRRDAP
jgi:hypothetical protein